MKLIFIDEFKPTSIKNISYGISVVVIDSAYYTNFKIGFEREFEKLGWSKEKELKGRYVYSKKVFEDISPENRIKFAEELFKLSSSNSGKSKRISVYISLGILDESNKEPEVYINLICKIFRKIGKPVNKKQDKNLIAFFLDENDAVTKKIKELDIYNIFKEKLHKDWMIFEKPFFVASSSLLPGIVFSDFISYFHQNYIDTKYFDLKTGDRFVELINKRKINLTEKEIKELEGYVINKNKNETSLQIITILKDIVYV